VFPSIVYVFYNIVTFVCITFDALQMHLIMTEGHAIVCGRGGQRVQGGRGVAYAARLARLAGIV